MEIKSKEIKLVDIDSIICNPKNNNIHTKEQIDRLCKLIKNTGFRNPLIVSNQSGFLIAGHGRLEAAKKLGMAQVPVVFQDFKNEADEYAFLTADNAIASWAELDLEKIKLDTLELEDFDLEMLGIEGFENLKSIEPPDGGTLGGEKLSDVFITSPFSVLDTRRGEWRDRVEFWKKLGIKSEEGRQENLLKFSDTMNKIKNGTSIFDPVLTEICYSWFSPLGGLVVDPFAGGSVRGVVASLIGRKYIGVDLRQEQVDANNGQLDLCKDGPAPTWVCSDSLKIDSVLKGVEADMIFSCPPYADLEVYSDDEKDLSNMDYDKFKAVYFEIIKKTCSLLKPDSFACFVVGEVRGKNKNGSYYNFVGDTIAAFNSAGLEYYNEIILVKDVGTVCMRASKFMKTSRKIGKVHQNVLVFVKGNAKKATEKCGEIYIKEDDHIDE